MWKKAIYSAVILGLIAVTVPAPSGAQELDSSYWANTLWTDVEGSINHSQGVVTFDTPTQPDQPWQVSWGKNIEAQKDKVYRLSFDARAVSSPAGHKVPISLRINKSIAPYTVYSQVKVLELDSTTRNYSVDLYSTASDENSVIGAWVGHEAGEFRFSNVELEVVDPPEPIEYHPLDNSYWANVPNAIDYAFGKVDIDVPARPDSPWQKSWGKTLSVEKDKEYVLSFDATAESYNGDSRVPISVRINQNAEPWSAYTKEKIIQLGPDKQHYTIELYNVATDPEAVLGIWAGHAAASYHFSNVSLEEREPATIIDSHPLDKSYWTNVEGALDYAFGTVQTDVPERPGEPWIRSWGKFQPVEKDKVYTLSFDAQAESPTSDSQVPISLRINQNYSPWSDLSKVKTVELDSTKQHYEVELYSVADEPNAVIGVWFGHAAADYEFSNIDLEVSEPATIIDSHPLDKSYWTNVEGALDYAFGTVNLDVPERPGEPWMRSWGKFQPVEKDKVYTLSFDARADSQVPISVRINRNYAPWNNLSEVKTIDVDNNKQHYEVELYSVANESNAVIGVWTGHEAADYEFSNVDLEVSEPDQTINAHPLDHTYWSNVDGAINYAYGWIDISVDQQSDEPWRKSWGKNVSLESGQTYVVEFDASAVDGGADTETPITVRLQDASDPYTIYSEEVITELDQAKEHYRVELTADTADQSAVLSVWTGHEAADYHFSDISFYKL